MGVTPLLEVRGLCGGYGPVQVLFGVDLEVGAGEVVALLGPNGAGKSTLLRALVGRVRPTAGSVRFDGRDVTGLAPEQVARAGLVHVAEGRRVFPTLTVDENLRMGTYVRRLSRAATVAELRSAYDLFPRLAERRDQRAGSLSGGEQQMLVIARAFLTRPRLLMVDEASLGLAPNTAESVFDAIGQLVREGLPVLVVEQYVRLALQVASRGYVLERGRVVLAAVAEELGRAGVMESSYLGTAERVAR